MFSPEWCFDRFRLDPTNACLWHDAKPVPLPPKVFDVLHYLATHPARLVTKEELLEAVWPATAVSEAVVRVAIGALRKALGDTPQTPRFLATVSRRGYRFLAPVEEYTEMAPGSVETGPPTAPRPPTMSLPAIPPQDTPDGYPRPSVVSPPVALPAPEAERRRLTILFCDLVDSTPLAEHLDPEDLREVVRAYHQTCAEVMQRFDGYIAQYLGAGVLVYFGYPVAHEDDTQRAVRAGLGMLDAMAPLNARLALPSEQQLAIRLGVHTGLVVVGEVGAGAHHEPLALGETPNIAARLQHLAAPGTLLLSATTYQLIADYFTCEALGERTLRGLTQPLQMYRVLGASGVRSRFEVAATRGLTPLVGRAPEVGLLLERWARVKEAMGQVVILEGEAGIGKSRLVQEIKDHLANEAHTCLECRGVPYYQHTAWYSITELLQRWLQWRPDEAPDETLRKLEALLAPLALAEAVPLMAGLLALPLPPERYPIRPLSSEQQRQKTFAALLGLVGALAERQPVLLIVEDLHWVDPSTLELLALLIDQVPTARLYAVFTCRPGLQPPWDFRAHLTPVALPRLTQSQAEAMVRRMPEGQRLPATVLAQIVARADGIPLFVEELTRAVLEAGHSADVQGPDARRGAFPTLAIPATLHEALLARLDRLGSAKGTAQLGATIGRQFSYALLRAVAPLEDGPLQQGLAALVAAELLYQRGQPPHAVYTFRHALIQEAAYESVLKSVRRQAHQRIVEVLEAQFPETAATQPELLAYHALRGEVWEKAMASFRQAGDQAMAHSAYREAVAAFEQALGALQHLPDRRHTLEQAIDLRFALRAVLWSLGEIERPFTNLHEAEVLAEALGDQHRLGRVAAYLSAHFGQVCDPDRALAAGQRALAIAEALGDVDLTVMVRTYLGAVYRSLGDYRQTVECYRKNVACLHGALRQEYFGRPGLASATSHSQLAVFLAECGAFTEGRSPAEEGVQIAEAANHPYSRVMAYWAVGRRALRQGNLQQAIPVLEQSLALAQEAHVRLLVPAVAAPLGAAYALAGRTADSLPLLEQAIEQAIEMRFMLEHALRVVWLGEAYLRAGRLDEAGTQAQRALDFARSHQERGHEAYALRLLGEVAAQPESPAVVQAEAHYRQALRLAEELGMRPLQAHCHRGLGTLYSQMEQREEARMALATALDMYNAMEMAFWIPQTEATLAQIGGRS